MAGDAKVGAQFLFIYVFRRPMKSAVTHVDLVFLLLYIAITGLETFMASLSVNSSSSTVTVHHHSPSNRNHEVAHTGLPVGSLSMQTVT